MDGALMGFRRCGQSNTQQPSVAHRFVGFRRAKRFLSTLAPRERPTTGLSHPSHPFCYGPAHINVHSICLKKAGRRYTAGRSLTHVWSLTVTFNVQSKCWPKVRRRYINWIVAIIPQISNTGEQLCWLNATFNVQSKCLWQVRRRCIFVAIVSQITNTGVKA